MFRKLQHDGCECCRENCGMKSADWPAHDPNGCQHKFAHDAAQALPAVGKKRSPQHVGRFEEQLQNRCEAVGDRIANSRQIRPIEFGDADITRFKRPVARERTPSTRHFAVFRITNTPQNAFRLKGNRARHAAGLQISQPLVGGFVRDGVCDVGHEFIAIFASELSGLKLLM